MKAFIRFVKNWGLSIVLIVIFLGTIWGQVHMGFAAYNDERARDGLSPLENYSAYLRSGHFLSSVSENMESEFLQLAAFVVLTIFLYQKGSSESKPPPEQTTAEDRSEHAREEAYRRRRLARHPLTWRLYENSLSLALLFLFAVFFLFHAYGSMDLINEERVKSGLSTITYLEVFSEPEFWFESFQNWQSEFFSVAVLGLLSIVLRQRGSPQSKKLHESAWDTGTS